MSWTRQDTARAHPACATRLRVVPGQDSRARGGPVWCLTGWGQGAGAEESLEAYDSLRAKHEAMPAEDFNKDGTYKGSINTVLHEGSVKIYGL